MDLERLYSLLSRNMPRIRGLGVPIMVRFQVGDFHALSINFFNQVRYSKCYITLSNLEDMP